MPLKRLGLAEVNITKALTGFTIAYLSVIPALHAETISIDATLRTRAVISATKTSDMNFGIVSYDPEHSGQIRLGTNGAASLGGSSRGLALGGATTPAEVVASGDGKSVIEISCDSGGTLSDGAGHLIPIAGTELAAGAGVDYGLGADCAGLGNAVMNFDLNSNPAPRIRMGARLEIGKNAIGSSTTYSTANGGGRPVTLQVVYQ